MLNLKERAKGRKTKSKIMPDKTIKIEKQTSDILYLRYDDANMKFVYLCAHCDTIWNTALK